MFSAFIDKEILSSSCNEGWTTGDNDLDAAFASKHACLLSSGTRAYIPVSAHFTASYKSSRLSFSGEPETPQFVSVRRQQPTRCHKSFSGCRQWVKRNIKSQCELRYSLITVTHECEVGPVTYAAGDAPMEISCEQWSLSHLANPGVLRAGVVTLAAGRSNYSTSNGVRSTESTMTTELTICIQLRCMLSLNMTKMFRLSVRVHNWDSIAYSWA